MEYIHWVIDNWSHIVDIAIGFVVAIVILLMAIIGSITDIGSSIFKNLRG